MVNNGSSNTGQLFLFVNGQQWFLQYWPIILFVNLKLKEDVFKLNELVSLIFRKIIDSYLKGMNTQN